MDDDLELQGAEPSVIASWLIHLVAIIEEFGLESEIEAILDEAGIDPELLNDPGARVPSEKMSRFYSIVGRVTDDAAIGLRLAERLTPGSMHALGYSLFASRTLLSFFNRCARFFRLISHAADASIELRDDRLVYVLKLREDMPALRQDAFIATVLRFARMVYRSSFTPMLVRMRRPEPKETSAQFDDFFCCPIEYGCDQLEMHVSKADYEQALRGANSEIVRHHDQIAMEYIARFDDQQIIPRIQSTIVRMLPDGDVSVEAVAADLGMGNRSLQRQLQNEGTTFNGVLDDIRRYLAIRYLRAGRHSIKEISYLLGYSDPSNFSRAFRRLAGQSPHEFLDKTEVRAK